MVHKESCKEAVIWFERKQRSYVRYAHTSARASTVFTVKELGRSYVSSLDLQTLDSHTAIASRTRSECKSKGWQIMCSDMFAMTECPYGIDC